MSKEIWTEMDGKMPQSIHGVVLYLPNVCVMTNAQVCGGYYDSLC